MGRGIGGGVRVCHRLRCPNRPILEIVYFRTNSNEQRANFAGEIEKSIHFRVYLKVLFSDFEQPVASPVSRHIARRSPGSPYKGYGWFIIWFDKMKTSNTRVLERWRYPPL